MATHEVSALIQRILAEYRRRIALRTGFVMALSLGCLAAALWRVWRAGVAWPWLAGLGLAGAAAVLWWRQRMIARSDRADAVDAPVALDRALKLEGRLMTAAQFAASEQPPSLYPALIQDPALSLSSVSRHLPRVVDRRACAVAALLLLLLAWPGRTSPLRQLLAQMPLTPPPPHPPAPEPTQPPPPPPQQDQQQQQHQQQQSGQQQQQQSGAGGQSRPETSDGGRGQQQQNQPQQQQSSGSGQQQGDRQQQESGGADQQQQQGGQQPEKPGESGQGRQDQQRDAKPSEKSGDRAQGKQGEDRGQRGQQQRDGAGERGQAGGDQQAKTGSQQQAQQAAGQQGSKAQRQSGQRDQPRPESADAGRGQQSEAGGQQQAAGGGQPMSSAQQEALKADIQKLLKEMSGELKELQMQLDPKQQQRPTAGTQTDPELYEAPSPLDAARGSQLPIQLNTDAKSTAAQRKGGGAGDASDQAVSAAPQQQPEAAELSAQSGHEQGVQRQAIPPEYRPVFERLSSSPESTEGSP